ncbi:hypothetical protein WA158_000116 [Blastocystis sp. Blastoise]
MVVESQSSITQRYLNKFENFGWYTLTFTVIAGVIALLEYTLASGVGLPIFFEGDPSISYPQQQETLPTLLLLLYYGVIPFAINVVIGYILYKDKGPHMIVFYRFVFNYIIYFVMCAILTNAFVYLCKNLFLNPRPDFFSRCGYKPYANGIYGEVGVLGDITKCSCIKSIDNPCSPHLLFDYYSSFPSGHSANAASFLITSTFVLLFFIQDIEIALSLKYIIYLCISLISSAAVVYAGATRVWNNRHRPVDITAGILIGCVISYLLFKWAFPNRTGKSNEKISDQPLCCFQVYINEPPAVVVNISDV